jgi:hypothetical protein
LTSFVRAPSPARVPTRNTFDDSASISARWRSYTGSGQANHQAHAAVAARAGPPDIGASMQSRPSAPSRSANPRCSPAPASAQHHARSGSQRRCRAVRAEQHGLALRRIDDGDDHDLALPRRARPATHAPRRPCAAAAVSRAGSMSRTPTANPRSRRAQRHPETHVADADEAGDRGGHGAVGP